MIHCLWYLWPSQGKTQIQCTLNSKFWLAKRWSLTICSICTVYLCKDSPGQVVPVTTCQGRRRLLWQPFGVPGCPSMMLVELPKADLLTSLPSSSLATELWDTAQSLELMELMAQSAGMARKGRDTSFHSGLERDLQAAKQACNLGVLSPASGFRGEEQKRPQSSLLFSPKPISICPYLRLSGPSVPTSHIFSPLSACHPSPSFYDHPFYYFYPSAVEMSKLLTGWQTVEVRFEYIWFHIPKG